MSETRAVTCLPVDWTGREEPEEGEPATLIDATGRLSTWVYLNGEWRLKLNTQERRQP